MQDNEAMYSGPRLSVEQRLLFWCIEFVVRSTGAVRTGDLVVIKGGKSLHRPGTTNFIKVETLD